MNARTVNIPALSDTALVERLHMTCRESNRLLTDVIVLLIEVEDRRIHLADAHPSLFEFCLKELRMSEGEAYRRINATKLVRRFPRLLGYIGRGDIHLTALVQLRDHFTEANVDELVALAKGKNKMKLAELVARLAPRPDVPAKLRKVPQHDIGSRVTEPRRPSIDPLSEARYRLQLTGSREFRDKLLRARDLMMHSNPSGDLAVVVERAIDELLELLEKRVYGKLSRKPAKTEASLHVVSGTAAADVDASEADVHSQRSVVKSPKPKKKASTARPGLASAACRSMKTDRRGHLNGKDPRRGATAPDTIHIRQRKSRAAGGAEPN